MGIIHGFAGQAARRALTIGYYYRGNWRKTALIATIDEAEEFVQSDTEPAGRMLPYA